MGIRTLLLTGVAVALSGCISSSMDPAVLSAQGFAPGAPGMSDGSLTEDQLSYTDMNADGGTETASAVALPVPSPNSADAASRQPIAEQTEVASGQSVVMADTAVDALNRGITQSQPIQSPANLYASTPAPAVISQQEIAVPQSEQAAPQAAVADMAPLSPDLAQAATQPQVQELAIVAPPKKKSIFARMFASQKPSSKNAPAGTKKRLVSPKAAPVTVASASSGGNSLPGVRLASLLDGGSGNSANNSGRDQVQLASAAGLARLAPNGLHLQTEKVDVGCFKPQLVRVLKTVERHYGRPLVVTSGYRSPKHNRRIGGASGSRHTSCEAADVQVEGVSKWQLAKYLRSMPGRGGVGTYCHTESVHIDIGNTRDWNWRCRRRK